MRDYRKIRAWREADDLTVAIYRATRSFPKEERYGLTSQVRRARVVDAVRPARQDQAQRSMGVRLRRVDVPGIDVAVHL